MKRLVVEALPVTKRDEAVVEARVEEAVAMKLLAPVKTMVVEVACSLVESLVHGHWKVVERVPVVKFNPEPRFRALKEPSPPMYGILESSAEAVTARLVVVAFVAVKFWRVEEPRARKLVA